MIPTTERRATTPGTTRSPSQKKSEKKTPLNGRGVFGCVFCSYGTTAPARSPIPRVPAAVHFAVPTYHGPRDLCALHARPFFVPECGAMPAATAHYAIVQP